jgi:hypothetical protein
MSDKRIYELTYPREDQPAFVKDIGNILQVSGIYFQGNGANLLVLLPVGDDNDDAITIIQPDPALMSEILRASDDPHFLDESNKAWVRKAQRSISGFTQQKIWTRDGYQCMFCGRRMGEVQLTIDHFIPLELGGKNDETNYVSACRRCNKDKGNIPPREYCGVNEYDYNGFILYLEGHIEKRQINHLARLLP